MSNLQGKTLFITGASRGIGLAIAKRAAADGANITIAAKTTEAQPTLPGTIYTAAEEIEAAGGKALACVVDVRSEEDVQAAMEKTVETFGGIDILVNNASAINLSNTESVPMKRYDLMHQINTRGTFMCSQKAIPHLRKSSNPHVLNLSPPLDMRAGWFAPHVAYTMAKYGMSLCALGMSLEFMQDKIAFNALWPKTAIATAAVQNHLGGEAMMAVSRTPEIMADAAYAIFCRPSAECSGNFFIDEEVLMQEGVTDFKQYMMDPKADPNNLALDLYVGDPLLS